MEGPLGGLLPVDFLHCDLSEDDHTFGEDEMASSSQGSPLQDEALILRSNNSAGDGSSDEQASESASSTSQQPRDYVNRGGELWNHWTWLGGTGKMSLMNCNYCPNKQLKNAPKCRRHLIKCPNCPEPIRKQFEKRELEANKVSEMMKEIRSQGIKVSRAKVLANNGTAEGLSTPQPVRSVNVSQSLLNSSAPASILQSLTDEDTPRPGSNNNNIANNINNGNKRKRKSTSGPQMIPNLLPGTQSQPHPNRLSADSMDLVKSILAPFQAQATVPPLPVTPMPPKKAIIRQTSPINANGNSSTDFTLDSLAAALATAGGANPMLNNPDILTAYLVSAPLRF